MSNYTRMPVRFVPQNQDLLKSQQPGHAGQRLGTDYRPNEEVVSKVGPGVQATYRMPPGRVNGNVLFRRYPNGALDLEYAVHKVVDALHRVKNSGGVDQLNSSEKSALSVLFPHSFDFVPPGMAAGVMTVNLRLSPAEVLQIKEAVATHLAEEMNYNAGLGGGSVPGRSSTKA